MKYLKLKTKDRGVVYINPSEIVFASVFNDRVHVETRTPGDGGGVSLDFEPLGDPQKALDDMMGPPRFGPFEEPTKALAEFRRMCAKSSDCSGCPYYKCGTEAECVIHWAFDQLKEVGK